MKLRNVLYGLFLCSIVSSVFAVDTDVFKLVEEQENKINFGVAHKTIAPANISELDDQHVLSAIAHPRDEEFKEDDSNISENSDVSISDTAKQDSEQSLDQAPGAQESTWFSLPSIKDLTKQHMFGLTAGAMFIGYSIYKVWDMFVVHAIEHVEDQLKVTLTYQDRDTLFALIQAMANDIENLRENKHEASCVAQIDLSSLSEILAPECKVICSNFVELYNAIDRSGDNIEIIIMFYGQFERALQALLLQAEII